MNNINICENRESFSIQLYKQITQSPSAIYCFLGKNGTGKEFVLSKVEKLLERQCECYQIIADSIYKKKFNFPNLKYTFGLSFKLTGLWGLSLSSTTNDGAKINYVIASLKRFTLKKNILVCIANYDYSSSEAREFLSILINNHHFIEKNIKKKITIILTSVNDFFYNFQNVSYIHFEDYSKSDLYNYLRYTLLCDTNLLTNSNIDNIYRLCGTNFDLVNSYYKHIMNTDETITIDAIVDKKMQFYIYSGCKYNITKVDLKNILYTAADSITSFTPHMIGSINKEININNIERSLICATEEYFLEKRINQNKNELENYLFISNDEKAYLCKTSILNHKKVSIQYYNYLSIYLEDEYLPRAQYLYQYFEEINKEIFALLVLALSKTYMLNDIIQRYSVKKFIDTSNIDCEKKIVFENLDRAYTEYYNRNYRQSNNIINLISLNQMSNVAIAEIRRLEFKNNQLGHLCYRDEMNTMMQQLRAYIENGLSVYSDIFVAQHEERILEMRIIFDIAPYALDTQNDVETFRELYDKSLILEKNIQSRAIKKSYTEYIVNIFNRKAFLFAAPAVALVHYEQAEAFFRENNIFSELAITLSSKAGISLSLRRYKDAINDLEEALKILKKNNIQVDQIEKIYNNLYIARFLNYETNSNSLDKINEFAKKTITNLQTLVDMNSNGKNHVILTNISSLSLYVNNLELYYDTKKKLETSLECKDVSNIDDLGINDFYRYHFAWFEFYRLLISHQWNECFTIIQNLSKFYPAIFHDHKKMDLRIKAANYLLENKIIPTSYDYCIHFLEYAQAPKDYFSRGLLLSDLQFTSYE